MRAACIILVVLLGLGCSTSAGGRFGSVHIAITSSLVDPRVGQKNVDTAHDGGVAVDVYKDPVSEQAAEMVTEVVPELAAAIAKALTAQAAAEAVCAIPALVGGLGATDVPVVDPTTVVPEVLH